MAGGKANRQAGDRHERACAAQLRAAGYLVIRSAGSLGPADLVALRADRLPVLVQCKRTDNTTRAERVRLREIGHGFAAVVVLAEKPSRGGPILWHGITENGGRTPYDIGEEPWQRQPTIAPNADGN